MNKFILLSTRERLEHAARAILAGRTSAIAKSYAEALLLQLAIDTPADVIHAQALYVRANLSTWRGDVARNVRATLDLFIASKGFREESL